ncbi:DUF1330 domain-containing protein [Desertibaculum subflavum]|uniref:DUF1330 domain-containing protein n=1 Tax=Desertibaculum subflavum TaxID=2268458 RepID=UPI000E6643A9
MTVYALAQIRIHDRARYERYVAGFMPILIQYGGRLLAAQEQPEPLQGDWPFDKIILMSFKDRESWRRWAMSPEYQEIAKDRVAATDGTVLLIDGIDAQPPISR